MDWAFLLDVLRQLLSGLPLTLQLAALSLSMGFVLAVLVAAAAGGSGMSTRQFLAADAAGALLSMTMLLGVGYVLGEAYDEAGPWLTAVGVVMLAVGAVVLGRSLKSAGPRR